MESDMGEEPRINLKFLALAYIHPVNEIGNTVREIDLGGSESRKGRLLAHSWHKDIS